MNKRIEVTIIETERLPYCVRLLRYLSQCKAGGVNEDNLTRIDILWSDITRRLRWRA